MIKDQTEMIDHCSQKENFPSKGFYLEGALHAICKGLPLRSSLGNPDLFKEIAASPSPASSLIHMSRAIRTGPSSKLWLCWSFIKLPRETSVPQERKQKRTSAAADSEDKDSMREWQGRDPYQQIWLLFLYPTNAQRTTSTEPFTLRMQLREQVWTWNNMASLQRW